MQEIIRLFDYAHFTLGMAQKWLNMAFKYIYCLYDIQDTLNLVLSLEKFENCHCPIDQRIMESVKSQNVFLQTTGTWSKLTDYDDYMCFQKGIRQIAKQNDTTVLNLELKFWSNSF